MFQYLERLVISIVIHSTNQRNQLANCDITEYIAVRRNRATPPGALQDPLHLLASFVLVLLLSGKAVKSYSIERIGPDDESFGLSSGFSAKNAYLKLLALCCIFRVGRILVDEYPCMHVESEYWPPYSTR